MPKGNAEFWAAKIQRNKARDRLVNRALRAKGWRVIRIWEHDLRSKRLEKTTSQIAAFIRESAS